MTPAKSTGTVAKAVKKAATTQDSASGDRARTASAKAPAKAPAKASRAKAPAKASRAKAPAKASPAKAPAKASSGKAPAKASRAKAPAKASRAKAPAKASRAKVPPAKPPAPKAKAPAIAAGASKKAPGTKAAPKKVEGRPYAKDTKFLDEQRVLLAAERAIYREQALDLKAEADSLAEEREPGDVQFDEESGEGGTVAVDRERDLVLSAQAHAAVEEIDAALLRIEDGTYGACERCHQAIPKARLRALPYARLCVACKSGGLSRR